jgi:hypothetical protein
MTKECSSCKQTKPITEFKLSPSGKNGLHNKCIPCMKQWRKEYRHKNAEHIAEYQSNYYENEPKGKRVKYTLVYIKQKYKEDPLYNYKERCRAVIKNALKKGSYKITSKPYKLLNCLYDDFKLYIEEQFVNGMNWSNYGEWHYDHIIPISSAKTEQEVDELNHYTNFQPLWAKDNRFKSSKI